LDACGWLVHTAPRRVPRWVGRALWWALRALIRVLGYAVVGLGWLLVRLGRYVLAYPEYAPLVRQLRQQDRPRRALTALQAWRRSVWRRAAGTTTAALITGLSAYLLVQRAGAVAVAALAVGAIAVLAGVGRAVRPRPPAPDTPALPPGMEEPFPIADAHTRAEAAQCVARAVAAEGITLRGTGEARRTAWGWEVPVVLLRGTPANLVTKLGELETTLDLPAGGLFAAPDRGRRARVVLRLAQRDPFASLRPVPHYPPGSLSIRDPHVIGQKINGEDLTLGLLGVHTVVIGTPGAGKSVTLRTLGDLLTACGDVLVWDMDPAGTGLDVLGGSIARRERHPAGITDALADAVAIAQARPHLLAQLGMGDAWQPDPDHPAIVVIIDEYPRLPEAAKALAVDLIRIGRKASVTVVLAASEATADTLGAAIADTTAVKLLLPCRHSDVRLVLGPNMIADGWRPDRLNPASGEHAEDAGRCYLYATGARDPIISKIRTLTRDQATHNGTQRATHGLPTLDPGSRHALRTHHHDRSGPPATNPQIITDVLGVFGTDTKLWTEEILTRLTTGHPRYTDWSAEDLATALRARWGSPPPRSGATNATETATTATPSPRPSTAGTPQPHQPTRPTHQGLAPPRPLAPSRPTHRPHKPALTSALDT
jgi:S-DNA-T family DNA segregation ATPase FtsK/SpoIIIE